MRGLALAACLLAATTAVVVHASVATLWPQPAKFTSGTTTLSVVQQSFAFSVSSDSGCQSSASPVATQFLAPAFARYTTYTFWWGANGSQPLSASEDGEFGAAAGATLPGLSVCVQSATTTLVFGTDESYSLTVPADGSGARLTAPTVFGALRGLETFSQLIEYDDTQDAYALAQAPITVADSPRFPWRGFMIDTARHYLPLPLIYHIIDALSFNKFNVLHWHLVDAQSFPFVSTSYPQLSDAGAYHPNAVYTPDTIRAVVRYAMTRGLRVVPEFDGPGHAAAWGLSDALRDITTNCPAYAHNINNINLSPASNLTLPVLQAVYGDAAALFPDAYLHVGGDEVVTDCWNDDPHVVAWMKSHGLDAQGTYQWFETQLSQLVAAQGKHMLVWEDPFDNGVTLPTATTTVEVWQSPATLQQVIAAGFNGILAAGNYLDQQIPDAAQTWYEFEDTWKNFYANDPEAGIDYATLELTHGATKAGTVLGGEGAMWAEQISEQNFDGRVWPRACAMAERFWSSKGLTDPAQALPRIDAHSCRMSRRGIRSGPLKPGFCLTSPNAGFDRY